MRDAIDKQSMVPELKSQANLLLRARSLIMIITLSFAKLQQTCCYKRNPPDIYIYNQWENCQHTTIGMAIFWNSTPIIFLTFNSSSHVQCFFNCFTPFYNIDWGKRLLQWIAVQFFYSISTYFLGSGSVDVVSTDFVLKTFMTTKDENSNCWFYETYTYYGV